MISQKQRDCLADILHAPVKAAEKLRIQLAKLEFHIRHDSQARAIMQEASVQEKKHADRVVKFLGIKGEDVLRLDYPLDENSLVFDVGGYKGDFASAIYATHKCRVMVFEPVSNYVEHLRWRFAKNPAIELFPVGLGGKTGKFTIYKDDDASSLLTGHGAPETIQIMDVAEFIAQHNIESVALIKINIEGGEYDLLERLLDTGLIEKIQHIQVQFHNFVPDADARRNAIREKLAKTHREMWNVDFVWESWEKKA